MSVLTILTTVFIFNVLLMAAAWVLARRWSFYSLVDVVWSWSFIPSSAIIFNLASGWSPRQWIILLLVSAWSVRLGLYLYRRLQHHFPVEDSRYQTLRASYGGGAAHRFFWFFQYQAWSVVFLSSIFVVISMNPSTEFHVLEMIGIALWLLSWLGEILADYQMSRFKADPANRGRVCERGLWRYSRHPNYFFESLIWWSYFLLAVTAPGGLLTVIVPASMLYLLLKVTGVPYAEEQSLKSRGEAYRQYQNRVSVFVPWFRKIQEKSDV